MNKRWNALYEPWSYPINEECLAKKFLEEKNNKKPYWLRSRIIHLVCPCKKCRQQTFP